MADVTIKLSRRYDHGSTPFDTVVLREPKLKDRRAVGPLFDIQRGIVLWDDERLWLYVDRLLTEPFSSGALELLDLVDAEAIEGAIKDFFVEASSRLARPTNSSSGSDGMPDASRP